MSLEIFLASFFFLPDFDSSLDIVIRVLLESFLILILTNLFG